MKKLILAAMLVVAGLCQSMAGNDSEAVFVVMPDTQTYMEQCPEVLKSQIDWIVSNRDSIDAVIHVGDITQENYPAEWALARIGLGRIRDAGIPLIVAIGNHDLGSRFLKCADSYNTTHANHYLPLSFFKSQPCWGGEFYPGKMDAGFIDIEAGGRTWTIISLPFGPSDAELEWAGKVADSRRSNLVVLDTHAYLYCDSTLLDKGDSWCPSDYGLANDSLRGRVNNGDGVWNKFVARHRNVIAVFCGHVLNQGVGTLVSKSNAGLPVYQMLANFQRGVYGSVMGGEGYLRIVRFKPAKRRIEVRTYSTWEHKFHPSPEHNFTFDDVPFDDYTVTGGH